VGSGGGKEEGEGERATEVSVARVLIVN
jgi:hypothetical protein